MAEYSFKICERSSFTKNAHCKTCSGEQPMEGGDKEVRQLYEILSWLDQIFLAKLFGGWRFLPLRVGSQDRHSMRFQSRHF